ncbi:MAG: hypothetical protein C0475_06050 [Planctomyces sp.]|nr:hypothetical protein [Planctomyces sp.]
MVRPIGAEGVGEWGRGDIGGWGCGGGGGGVAAWIRAGPAPIDAWTLAPGCECPRGMCPGCVRWSRAGRGFLART